MNFSNLAQRFRNLFQHKPDLPDPVVEKLIRSLEETCDEECGCDEVYALLDQYAEAHIRGEDVERLMPVLKQHMSVCQECREEYEALIKALQAMQS